MRRGVADFLHGQPNPAGFLVKALVAWAVCRLTDAGRQGQRPFEDPNDLTHRDIAWLAAESVPAPSPLLAVDETVALQIEQDRLEELPRKPLLFSKFRGLNW